MASSFERRQVTSEGEGGSRKKAISCSQRPGWWIQTEGGMLSSKNGNVLSEGREWQHVFRGGRGISCFRSTVCLFIGDSSSIGDGMYLEGGVFFSDEGIFIRYVA